MPGSGLRRARTCYRRGGAQSGRSRHNEGAPVPAKRILLRNIAPWIAERRCAFPLRSGSSPGRGRLAMADGGRGAPLLWRTVSATTEDRCAPGIRWPPPASRSAPCEDLAPAPGAPSERIAPVVPSCSNCWATIRSPARLRRAGSGSYRPRRLASIRPQAGIAPKKTQTASTKTHGPAELSQIYSEQFQVFRRGIHGNETGQDSCGRLVNHGDQGTPRAARAEPCPFAAAPNDGIAAAMFQLCFRFD